MDLTTGEGKLRAVNFLLPYVQRIPNRILRSEWATRIAQQLRLDEPVLRAALSKAATERRSEVKTQPELVGKPIKDAESELIRVLVEDTESRREIAEKLQSEHLYDGLETEKIFTALIVAALAGGPVDPVEIAGLLEERERRILFEILFQPEQAHRLKDAEVCLQKLRLRKAKAGLGELQREIERQVQESGPTTPKALELQSRKLELSKAKAMLETKIQDTGSKSHEEGDEVLSDIQRMIAESQRKYCNPKH
jgi:DNA primase